MDYALKGYGKDENNFEALRWTAVLCGATTDYLGIKERIETAKKFKVRFALQSAIGLFDIHFSPIKKANISSRNY